ncbi:hypothetical protein A3Q56_01704 [Intoshia linei]|uniref:Uncharacterized protein n=1 Tax=Intoshia linei TaxID=1819745 RepID=A0A177B8Q9_9BILA|nr:hypothetical protein A3Q56_01704 [Intoshia linei]
MAKNDLHSACYENIQFNLPKQSVQTLSKVVESDWKLLKKLGLLSFNSHDSSSVVISNRGFNRSSNVNHRLSTLKQNNSLKLKQNDSTLTNYTNLVNISNMRAPHVKPTEIKSVPTTTITHKFVKLARPPTASNCHIPLKKPKIQENVYEQNIQPAHSQNVNTNKVYSKLYSNANQVDSSGIGQSIAKSLVTSEMPVMKHPSEPNRVYVNNSNISGSKSRERPEVSHVNRLNQQMNVRLSSPLLVNLLGKKSKETNEPFSSNIVGKPTSMNYAKNSNNQNYQYFNCDNKQYTPNSHLNMYPPNNVYKGKRATTPNVHVYSVRPRMNSIRKQLPQREIRPATPRPTAKPRQTPVPSVDSNGSETVEKEVFYEYSTPVPNAYIKNDVNQIHRPHYVNVRTQNNQMWNYDANHATNMPLQRRTPDNQNFRRVYRAENRMKIPQMDPNMYKYKNVINGSALTQNAHSRRNIAYSTTHFTKNVNDYEYQNRMQQNAYKNYYEGQQIMQQPNQVYTNNVQYQNQKFKVMHDQRYQYRGQVRNMNVNQPRIEKEAQRMYNDPNVQYRGNVMVQRNEKYANFQNTQNKNIGLTPRTPCSPHNSTSSMSPNVMHPNRLTNATMRHVKYRMNPAHLNSMHPPSMYKKNEYLMHDPQYSQVNLKSNIQQTPISRTSTPQEYKQPLSVKPNQHFSRPVKSLRYSTPHDNYNEQYFTIPENPYSVYSTMPNNLNQRMQYTNEPINNYPQPTQEYVNNKSMDSYKNYVPHTYKNRKMAKFTAEKLVQDAKNSSQLPNAVDMEVADKIESYDFLVSLIQETSPKNG